MNVKLFKFLLVFALVIGAVVACNKEEFVSEQAPQEVELRGDKLITYGSDAIPGRYIVVMDESAVADDLRGSSSYAQSKRITSQVAGRVLAARGVSARVGATFAASIRGFVAEMSPAQAARLAADPAVKYVEQDQVIRLQGGPPGGGGNSCANNSSETTPCGVNVVGGGANYTGTNVAWIIDTGIDLDHPDLNVDANRGIYVSGMTGQDANLDDGNGHGTHVAGTVAAIKGNGIGVVGVAAGATVIPVKVLNKRGSGSYSGVIEGIDHVGEYGEAGDVANMSLGGSFSQAVNNAVINASNKGIFFALAAGNESTNAGTKSPASANGANVYTISSMNCAGNWSSFSNYGNPPVDYCAPGSGVCSTYKGGGYASLSGTSMAAPHAAGVLLVTGGNPNSCGTVNGDPASPADPIICIN